MWLNTDMDPQPVSPQPTNNYDFILNPEKQQKRKLFGAADGKSGFITKIAFLVGGAVVVMIVIAVLVNLIFGSKTNLDSIVSLTQTEQEIIRLSGEGKDAVSQDVKNPAINTKLTVASHQKAWLAYLSKHKREVKKDELNLKKSAASDRKLTLAQQTSTFDTTYTTLMRSSLTDYAKAIKTAYDGTSSKQQREILNKQYRDAVVLLKQWPASDVGLAGN